MIFKAGDWVICKEEHSWRYVVTNREAGKLIVKDTFPKAAPHGKLMYINLPHESDTYLVNIDHFELAEGWKMPKYQSTKCTCGESAIGGKNHSPRCDLVRSGKVESTIGKLVDIYE